MATQANNYIIPVYLPTIEQLGNAKQALLRENNYDNVKVIEANEVTDKSKATGHAIFMPLQFDPVSYEDGNGNTVSLNGLYIPCAICEFTMTKNIVKTTIASKKFRGTVKEFVGEGDWQVSIKGMLVGEGMAYPEDDFKKLKQYLSCPKEFGVTHDICTMLGIYYIVIETPSITNKQGFENMQPFSISAVSDEAAEGQLSF